MCVAILQKQGAELSGAQLFSGWTTNADGGGLAYIDDDGKVRIESGFLQYNPFEKAYRAAVKRYGNNGPMLVHMRIRSAGSLGKKNCHPFPIKGGAMCHNGTMFYPSTDYRDTKADRKSDTRIFAEKFYNILDLDSVKKAEKGILKAVGGHNKLLFLYDGGESHIINEDAGDWNEEKTIWFSNSSCEVRRSFPQHGR